VERARIALTLCVGTLAACRGDAREAALPLPGEQGPRVVVEVLNASGRPGLARIGARMLRREGIDVVSLGNAPGEDGTLDTTRIVVRRGTLAVGAAIQKALGVGRVLLQPDSARLLDASVLLGGDFSPHLEFHP
jgi:LytR cell envelope-related transcriptional attenuator